MADGLSSRHIVARFDAFGMIFVQLPVIIDALFC